MVLHQGDERRNDERGSVEQHRRQLIAERFAGAGGEQSESRFASEERAHDRFLPLAELLMAEVRAKRSEQVRVHVKVVSDHLVEDKPGMEIYTRRMEAVPSIALLSGWHP